MTPEIDASRFPIKGITGDEIVVEADLLADGHDALSGALVYRREGDPAWSAAPCQGDSHEAEIRRENAK